MKASDVVVEFVVTGSVGLLLVLALGGILGLQLDFGAIVPEQPFSKAVAGVLALPAVYYLGIAVHHASWWFWRRLFHRRLFARIFKCDDPRAAHRAMRKLAAEAYRIGGSPLGDDPGWEGKVEWCRFALLQHGSADTRREYSRQYHLYRAAYGPLFALAIALLFALGRLAYDPLSWWLPLTLVAGLLVLLHAAWHRGGRMWKSLCYSVYIGMHRVPQGSESGPAAGRERSGAPGQGQGVA